MLVVVGGDRDDQHVMLVFSLSLLVVIIMVMIMLILQQAMPRCGGGGGATLALASRVAPLSRNRTILALANCVALL